MENVIWIHFGVVGVFFPVDSFIQPGKNVGMVRMHAHARTHKTQ